MSQADLGTAHPLETNRPGPTRAETNAPTKRQLRRFLGGLLGSAARIAGYAGATVAIGLIVAVLALLASGILAI